jgi:uncharacterized protein (TIGR02996 family)
MTDDAAFLAAIADRPDDDLPRLVFADYLDEHGDAARAEFVRVQCELAALPRTDPRFPVLEEREAELLAAHKKRWELPNVGRQTFRRGFVEVVDTTADRFLAAARRFLALVPVRELRLRNADRRIAELAALPIFARVESLDLANNTLGAGNRITRFFGTADLPRLRTLKLRNNRLWAEAITELSATPIAPQLARLDLSGNPFADAGAEALAAATGFRNVTVLELRNDELTFSDSIHAAGAIALAESEALTKLRRLDLGSQYVGDAGLVAVVNAPNAANLVSLDVSYNEIGTSGESGYEAVAASPWLRHLTELNLCGNAIDRRGATALLGSATLPAGLRIDLRECEMDAGTREVLARRPERFFIDLQ